MLQIYTHNFHTDFQTAYKKKVKLKWKYINIISKLSDLCFLLKKR